ncbi:MAG TPA: DUF4157 domain-containing protein [Kofleriaceae bacterium]
MGNDRVDRTRGGIEAGGVQRAAGPAGVAPGKQTLVEAAASQELPAALRGPFEQSLGADLGGVRVHTGADSAAAASGMSARAFAVGGDIHFGAGQYRPDDTAGQHLIAHEVAHTVQQARVGQATPAKADMSHPSDPAEVEADRAADAMVSGQPFSVAATPSHAIHRDTGTPVPVPAPALDLDAELAGANPDYPKVLAALNNLDMLAMVQRLDKLRAHLGKLLGHMAGDTNPGISRIRAAVLAVQLKGTDTTTEAGGKKLEQVMAELTAAKVAVWERVDVAVFLEGSAGAMRKQVLDDLASQIDHAILTIKEVELDKPSVEKGTALEADRKGEAEVRDKALRLVHDYMRLVDAELAVIADPELTTRKKQKDRFDRFKMMRESEALDDKMLHATSDADYQAAKARKYELDKLLGKDGPDRKAVGTTGTHDGKTYVVYEDTVKLGGDLAWINNNPGNMIASPLATNFKNQTFSIFPTMALGYAAIPMQLKQWRMDHPGVYTLLTTFKQWANRPKDNPEAYAASVAAGLNAKGITAKGAKVTKATLLDDLDEAALMMMGEVMGQSVEGMKTGTTYHRSDMTAEPWLKPLLGPPYP